MAEGMNMIFNANKDGTVDIWYKGILVGYKQSEAQLNDFLERLTNQE